MHRTTLGMFVAVAALGLACQGQKGDAGPEGPQGLQGQQGPAGTFTGSFAGNATIAGDLNVQGQVNLPLGEAPNSPATSCAALLTARAGIPSGVYWVRPSSANEPFRVYCDMNNEGGGWTLVWSNLRGGRGKVFTEIQWKAAINTLPRVNGELGKDLESFAVFTGLKHWTALAPGGLFRTEWAPDYGSAVQQRYLCPFTFSNLATYQITFNVPLCTQPVGSVVPGLVVSQNNAKLTAYDVDNDTDPGNCAAQFSNAPWWYTNCWDGALVGGGEQNGGGYFNGAYWRGSAQQWGGLLGVGAGNGWIYVK